MSKLEEVTKITDGLRASFKKDNFTERRNSGPSAGVAYDPESLLTGWEAERGLGYKHHRVFFSIEAWKDSLAGQIPSVLIPLIAPRVNIGKYLSDIGTICVEELQELFESDPNACLLPIRWLLEDAQAAAAGYIDTLSGEDATRGLALFEKYGKK